MISTDNRLVSPNQWFDFVGSFSYGYAEVSLNDNWNWIDKNGDILSPEQWFDEVFKFINSYGIAVLNNKWYWIDTNGQLYNYDTMQPIDLPNTNNITLNELKHIIRESIKRQLLNES